MSIHPDESQCIRILLLLADTQTWLNDLGLQLLDNIYPPAKKIVNAKTYRLSITALAHIIERHYYKTMRHPGTGKFTIPLSAVLEHVNDAVAAEVQPMKGNRNSKRIVQFPESIGINKNGNAAHTMIIITDPTDNIITAYPE